MNPYITEVIDLHVLIEALFARGEGSAALLLKHFHEDFKMITPGGAILRLDQVSALFEKQTGAQPGLEIEVSDLETLAHWSDGAIVGYRETHRSLGSPPRSRLSSVLFSKVDGKTLWRHLHETLTS